MDPYTYVRNLSLGRRLEQASSLPAAEAANPFNLDPDLNLAIDRGFFIQPVLAEKISRFSLVGVPENSPEQIAAWASTLKNCNWALTLEDSGVLALEIEPDLSLDAIAWISHRSGLEWKRTLQFYSGSHHYAFLARPQSEFRNPGTTFPGLSLLSRGTLIIPPSTRSGVNLGYTDRRAPILEAPPSLFLALPFRNRSVVDLASGW
jgi:hypothetical protein